MADNHVMDSGPESMLEVLNRLSNIGVHTVGAGVNLAAAREPAIIEYVKKGINTQNLNGAVSSEDSITLGGYKTVRVVPAGRCWLMGTGTELWGQAPSYGDRHRAMGTGTELWGPPS